MNLKNGFDFIQEDSRARKNRLVFGYDLWITKERFFTI